MASPDGFIRKSKVAICSSDIKIIVFEKVASFGQPIIVTTDADLPDQDVAVSGLDVTITYGQKNN